MFVSCRIYWKEATDDAFDKPQALSELRGVNSVALNRLGTGTWGDVDKTVTVDEYEGRPRITVGGCLHGRRRRKNLFLVRNVTLEIIADTHHQHNVWVERIRARIAPWALLQQRVKDVASHSPSSTAEELEKGIGGLISKNIPTVTPYNVTENQDDNLRMLQERIQKLTIVDELTAHSTAAVETGATFTTIMASVELVAETAEYVASLSKSFAGVSTVFHLVALSAHVASMCAEANRGRRVLPIALGRIVILLRYVLESMTEIMSPSLSVRKIDEDFVFDVLKQTVSAMDVAETQLLRGRGSQFLNASDVKEVERKMKELEPLVVIAGNISRTSMVVRRVSEIESEWHCPTDEVHHVRPSVSAFFVGRTKELDRLRNILEKRGSAVITQYGGVGKTELMIAFADGAEQQELVPGGVFWMTVDGDVRDVLGALAGLVEKITRRKMSEEEHQNPNLVIAALKQALGQRQGRWLLCLDNADNSEVNGVLNGVCTIAGTQENGWVVVTSRQGQPRVWNRMKDDQKLVLEPLCVEDAMMALWRQGRVIENDDADDSRVMADINKLKEEDQVEYYALKELCGDDGAHSLGGLPLALVQAGSYIARFSCSFGKYLNLFRNANRKEELQSIMKNTVELTPIRESQRSIWTTWRISVEQLSDEAFAVLRAMAMLGQAPIGETIVNRILEAATPDGQRSVDEMFRSVFLEELVHGSSLIYRDEGHDMGSAYSMHRLVRRFILSDMERGSVLWNDVYNLALFSVHECIDAELKKENKTFEEFSDLYGSNHRKLEPHALALIDHHSLPSAGTDIQHVSKVGDIHRYGGYFLEFSGKIEEEVHVWECLLAILHRQYGENDVKSCVADAHSSLGNALSVMGKLADAASTLEHSLKMYRRIHGHETAHPEIAMALNDLALVYSNQGNLERAAMLLEQSLSMYRMVHRAESVHPDIATALSNLANVYRDQGKLVRAMEMHEKSLAMERMIYGENKAHPTIAISLNNLAITYQEHGKLERAVALLEQSLEMQRTLYGAKSVHPGIAGTLSNLANVYREQGKLTEALEMHEQSLAMKRIIHGNDKAHPEIAISLGNLAVVHRKRKELERAVLLLEQSLEMRRIVHGADSAHPEIVKLLANLIDVYQEQGKRVKAQEIREQKAKIEHAS